ncbi:MAG TPA: histidinol dehydrogenase [Nitrososphaera sp.]|nr:histidinol dehydrogenase [Nitrososphaera sp.]
MKIINVAEPAAEAARLRKATAMPESIFADARAIMKGVAEQGDSAVLDYTAKFDGARPASLLVSRQESKQAYGRVTKEQVKAVRLMKERLAKSELAVLKRLKGISVSSGGVKIERMVKPVASVGCYIPGRKARYPSTVVMCAVPAKVAGVRRIVAISPPRKDGTIDPLTLVAADICGVDEFYKAGGAQGIAALAYGTQSIKPVSKIVGPGGMFVAAAKLIASGSVSTDMVAGPTELLIYADATADPRLIAIDLISQAEHGTDTICGLVTASEKLAAQTQAQVQSMAEKVTRSDIVKSSLQDNGFVAVCKNEGACVEFVNEFAPEHLEIMSKNADAVAKKIDSAGLVLVGRYAPSSASDYSLGSNHVLPTLGFGKSRASLSVLDFVKLVNKVKVTKAGLAKVNRSVKEMASAEGLLNHYEAVRARTDEV